MPKKKESISVPDVSSTASDVPVVSSVPEEEPKLFVVKEKRSGHIHSEPLPHLQAQEKLKSVEEKERREHPKEAVYEFVIEEA